MRFIGGGVSFSIALEFQVFFSRTCFIDLKRCLHLTNSRAHGNVEGSALEYDKLQQT